MVGNSVEGVDGLHVHNGLVELELFVDEDLLSQGVALSSTKRYLCLFCDLGRLFHVLLRLLFFISSHQLLGLVLEYLNLVVELLLLLFKVLDLEVQIVERNLNLDLLLCYLLSLSLGGLGSSCGLLLFTATEQLVKERHLKYLSIISQLLLVNSMCKNEE